MRGALERTDKMSRQMVPLARIRYVTPQQKQQHSKPDEQNGAAYRTCRTCCTPLKLYDANMKWPKDPTLIVCWGCLAKEVVSLRERVRRQNQALRRFRGNTA